MRRLARRVAEGCEGAAVCVACRRARRRWRHAKDRVQLRRKLRRLARRVAELLEELGRGRALSLDDLTLDLRSTGMEQANEPEKEAMADGTRETCSCRSSSTSVARSTARARCRRFWNHTCTWRLLTPSSSEIAWRTSIGGKWSRSNALSSTSRCDFLMFHRGGFADGGAAWCSICMYGPGAYCGAGICTSAYICARVQISGGMGFKSTRTAWARGRHGCGAPGPVQRCAGGGAGHGPAAGAASDACSEPQPGPPMGHG